ncbi:sm-like protein LSM1A [Impatiens glandulifera]|uniref:sm-like protein LSM1A n=1 Tax=Impatiens glandulifera TaxID=253017 RepID=UPI001FB18075|nr:sm-like protein LSM1A [Impatiens glandulifera]
MAREMARFSGLHLPKLYSDHRPIILKGLVQTRTGQEHKPFRFLAAWKKIFTCQHLASYLDKKLIVLLRDGRKLMGILRSFDQFTNVVIEGAYERVIVGDIYCGIPLGLYIIRGENVILIDEMNLEKEELPPHMTSILLTEITRTQKMERKASNLKGTMRRIMEFPNMD